MVGVLVGILILGFLVMTHEMGHLLMAKLFRVKVPEFSVGMGPKLCGKTIGGTAYNLRLIPIGGYCALEGEDAVSDDPGAFGNKTVLERILIVVGGPLFNIITALIMATVLVLCIGANTPVVYQVDDTISHGLQVGDVIMEIDGTPIATGRDISSHLLSKGLGESVYVKYYRDGAALETTYDTAYEVYRIGIQYSIIDGDEAVLTVSEDSAAHEAGLQTGDKVLSVDGVEVADGQAMAKAFDETGIDEGKAVHLEVLRDEETLTFDVTPRLVTGNSIGFSAEGFRDNTCGVGEKLLYGVHEVVGWEKYTLASLKSLVTGGVKLSDMTGPVGIVGAVSDTVETTAAKRGLFEAFINVLNIATLLAVNIGMMNLLPIPALDGGRLVFLFIEAIRKKRVRPDIEATVHAVGMGLLLLLMGFVMVQDALRMMF